MNTTQDGFHPMKGHVADGVEVLMNNGDIVTIKSCMKGWQLYDGEGRPFGVSTNSAHVIACLIYNYPLEIL